MAVVLRPPSTDAIKREHQLRQRRYWFAQGPMIAGLLVAVWAGTTRREALFGISPLWSALAGFVVFVAGVAWSWNDYRCPACNARLFSTAKRVHQTGRCTSCEVELR
jgi:hypothetical protein